MPDTPFKAMGREKPITRADLQPEAWFAVPSTLCDKCGGLIRQGDWPFCKNGRKEDHQR